MSVQTDKENPEKKPAWRGELMLAPGWAHYRGPVGDTSFHNHYPVQILFSRSREARVIILDELFQGSCLIVPSRVRHQLLPSQDWLDLLFIEPTLMGNRTTNLNSLADWLDYLEKGPLETKDPRMLAALAEIEKSLASKINLADIAKSAGMSKSLFSRKFRELNGIPLRRFVLWKRLLRAIKVMGEVKSATKAAHASGFSDSAHFSRTMKQTFGVSPSDSVKPVKVTLMPLPSTQD